LDIKSNKHWCCEDGIDLLLEVLVDQVWQSQCMDLGSG
jgi:hypothetical protein